MFCKIILINQAHLKMLHKKVEKLRSLPKSQDRFLPDSEPLLRRLEMFHLAFPTLQPLEALELMPWPFLFKALSRCKSYFVDFVFEQRSCFCSKLVFFHHTTEQLMNFYFKTDNLICPFLFTLTLSLQLSKRNLG